MDIMNYSVLNKYSESNKVFYKPNKTTNNWFMNVFIAVLATINLSHQKSGQAVLISCTVQALQQNKVKMMIHES